MPATIDSLWDTHKDEVCFIIGTGPSIAFYPPEFIKSLEGKLTIGLNEAWRYLKCTYHLSIHYECIIPRPELNWITKKKGYPKRLDISKYILFKSNSEYRQSTDNFTLVRKISGSLYVGRGIHTSAMVLAAHMGCKFGILIGVDCGSLDGHHHGHNQHVQFHGLEPNTVYNEYYENAVKLREYIWQKYSCGFVSLSPFIGLHSIATDTHYLKNVYGIIEPDKEQTKDISTYRRKAVDQFLK